MKLFFSVFFLIFLAELGDKTQLTAMAKSASGDKWVVFFAASAALTCSTLVAVLFGSTLTKVVPEYVIKGVAGTLFIVFGILLLKEVITTKPEKAEVKEAKISWIGKAVLEQAITIEEYALGNYEKMAAETTDESVKSLLLKLVEEEKQHIASIRNDDSLDESYEVPEKVAENIPEVLAKPESEEAALILTHAYEHELATANFFKEMANHSKIPQVEQLFIKLAKEEQQHAASIKKYLPDNSENA